MPIPFLNSINLTKNQVENFCIYNLANDPIGSLTAAGDYGYFWLNTSGTKTLKFWDGANIRSLIDSTTISSSTSGSANDLTGGLAGSLPYQQGAGDTTFLGIGTADQVLTVNSGATAPQWLSQSSLSVGSATNKTGGNLGDILVQSGSGTTSFLNAGTAGQVITSNGASPQYVNQSTLSVGSATTATTATNVAGGANGSILVQSGAGTTGQLAIGASGYILTSNGTTPGWSASIPSTSVSGLAASATTDTTNASNISSGTLGLARLSLATGQFYVGDGSNNPAATAKSSIPLSGFGAAGADVAMGGFKITGLGTPTASTDAATMGYVDSVAQGLDVKASCLVASTADITLASPGAITIDGIYSATDFTSGSTRILVKDQSAPAENGIYIWQGPAAAMTRSADADTWDELVGAFTFIERGTANADSGWVCTVNAGGTLGSTAVTWVKFSQAGSYTQGRGMVLDGTAFNFAQNTNYTADTIPYASGATTIGFIGAGTADQVLRVPGAGGTPAFGAIDLTKSAAVTGALPAANGGTGQSSYAVGDILFADSATSLAKLADVATGNALISGGVTTAPSWGKIGLTTHVSGTLPVGNGGTGATTFTAGQVLYGNGTSALSSSANLFWDNANNRLGIGTATPAATLTVNTSSSAGSAYISSDSTGGSFRSSGNLQFYTDNAAYSIDWFSANKGSLKMRLTNDGNLGLGVTPDTKLHLSGTGNQELKIQTNTSGNPILTLVAAGQDSASILYNRTDNYLSVNVSAITGALRLTTSGNLGLGVTPSAWAGGKAFQLGSAIADASLSGLGDDTNIATNAYYNAGWKYINGGYTAARYRQSGGVHSWFTATAGGSNGAAISDFTSAKMTLDASGRLGIGTATINERLEVYGYGKFSSGWKIDTQGIAYGDTGNSLVIGADPGNASANSSIQLMVDGSERLRIKSTGQVNFVGLASDPAGAAGDVYYNSGSNVFKVYDTGWKTLPRKYVVQLSDGSVTVAGNAYTITHNLGSQDVTVSIRRTTDNAVVQADVVMPAGGNTVTVTFAAAITAAQFYVTVIG